MQSIEIGSNQAFKHDSCSNVVDEIADEDDVGLKDLCRRPDMKNLIISALILFTLISSCQSLQAVHISRETSMAILANISSNSGNQAVNISKESNVAILGNFSSNSGNQLEKNSNITKNQTNRPHTNISINNAAANLWSWGEKIPMGYGLNKNGSLKSWPFRIGNQAFKDKVVNGMNDNDPTI